MKLTIITLTFNNAHLLAETIKSVLSQKIKCSKLIEYLIVDDGSANFNERELWDIVSDNLNDQFIVKIIKNEINMGTVKSFNNAIIKSEGDIIIPLSAGDVFFNELVLCKICSIFKDRKINVATGRCAIIEEKGEKVINEFPNKNIEPFFSPMHNAKLLNKLCIEGNLITGAATYYRKQFLMAQGGFDESYVLLEDYPFYIRTLEMGESIHFINELVIKYKLGGVSTNKKKLHPKLEADFDNLVRQIMEKDYLSQFQKKYVFYKRFVKKKDKLKINIIMTYPLQTLAYIYSLAVKKIMF